MEEEYFPPMVQNTWKILNEEDSLSLMQQFAGNLARVKKPIKN